MTTGLEGDIQCRTPRLRTGLAQGSDLCVLLAVAPVKSLADDLAITNDDGADHGIRRRLSPAASG